MKPLAIVVALMASPAAWAAAPQPLAARDVPTLVAPPAKGTKVVALWSLDCAYCEENLSALRDWQRSHADVQLVFVATDPVAQAAALQQRLAAAHLDDVPSRAYAEATPDRINFLMDPAWGGETPRTLVIRSDGTRKGVSGALIPSRLHALLD